MTEERKDQLSRWRLILGEAAEERLSGLGGGEPLLDRDQQLMDEALAAIYDGTSGGFGGEDEDPRSGRRRSAGSGPSAPRLARWLADIRSFFPSDVVSVIQSDAMERKGLRQLLFEPELLSQVKPDIRMVATLMALKGSIPEKTKDTARQLVKAVVDDIAKRLENEIRRSVTGALNRRQHSPLPSLSGMDWKKTITSNLKHYDRESKRLIPERFHYFDRARRSREWTVILDIDQSGSMADSVIYASVIGSIFASLPALDTRVVVFDTEVVDLSEQCADDPVDMLFGIQLGGGTDINKSVAYCEQFITEPGKTLFLLISDLYEGGNQAALIRRMGEMRAAGVKVLCLLALSDSGVPSYDAEVAKKLASFGIPCFACTPDRLAELVEGALQGKDLQELAARVGSVTTAK
ncbi:VWA containing CoxE family protein [Paenibacillus mucilaginosus 3016]|uniref:VWA containing CoxE family protein n=2 Tax=Paenibacillus mucilaginosus TaxID=61624 RepID=H6NB35_9BACL|nr:VWA domain-containing protein [Paenibacillus mucilaginosus]AFC31290.1 VWA containing CoxE family protein [Paenibacillus mucilaginosus 3016]AFH63617.1 von Willebrand factor A [Paenibacillus mucilaginosus K02]WFA19857.1 VWA domain-containing protein [Paenibacillus mucilaginosus]